VRFYWCGWCQELFAFVGENALGGRGAGSFIRDDSDGWLHESCGTEEDVALALSAINQIGNEIARRMDMNAAASHRASDVY
jgi:hypothetical protein